MPVIRAPASSGVLPQMCERALDFYHRPYLRKNCGCISQLKEFAVLLCRYSHIATLQSGTVDTVKELLHIDIEVNRYLIVPVYRDPLDDVPADHLFRGDIAAVKNL